MRRRTNRSRPRPVRQRWRRLADAPPPTALRGGSRWDEAAREAVTRFAERFALPVATGFRRLPLCDPLDPNYAGDLGLAANPALLARIKAADLVLAIGARLSEVTTQNYGLFEIPAPKAKLVHVFPGAEELGRVWRPQLAINATPTRFAAALGRLAPPASPAWRSAT